MSFTEPLSKAFLGSVRVISNSATINELRRWAGFLALQEGYVLQLPRRFRVTKRDTHQILKGFRYVLNNGRNLLHPSKLPSITSVIETIFSVDYAISVTKDRRYPQPMDFITVFWRPYTATRQLSYMCVLLTDLLPEIATDGRLSRIISLLQCVWIRLVYLQSMILVASPHMFSDLAIRRVDHAELGQYPFLTNSSTFVRLSDLSIDFASLPQRLIVQPMILFPHHPWTLIVGDSERGGYTVLQMYALTLAPCSPDDCLSLQGKHDVTFTVYAFVDGSIVIGAVRGLVEAHEMARATMCSIDVGSFQIIVGDGLRLDSASNLRLYPGYMARESRPLLECVQDRLRLLTLLPDILRHGDHRIFLGITTNTQLVDKLLRSVNRVANTASEYLQAIKIPSIHSRMMCDVTRLLTGKLLMLPGTKGTISLQPIRRVKQPFSSGFRRFGICHYSIPPAVVLHEISYSSLYCPSSPLAMSSETKIANFDIDIDMAKQNAMYNMLSITGSSDTRFQGISIEMNASDRLYLLGNMGAIIEVFINLYIDPREQSDAAQPISGSQDYLRPLHISSTCSMLLQQPNWIYVVDNDTDSLVFAVVIGCIARVSLQKLICRHERYCLRTFDQISDFVEVSEKRAEPVLLDVLSIDQLTEFVSMHLSDSDAVPAKLPSVPIRKRRQRDSELLHPEPKRPKTTTPAVNIDYLPHLYTPSVVN